MSYFKPRNLLLVLALGLALSLLVVIVLNYRPGRELQTLVESLPKGIDISLQDIDYTHTEEGQARWRLVAGQVERHAASGILGVDSPQMSFYDAEGELTGSLQAGEGEVSEDYRKVQLLGDVVLKSSAGYTLYTDHLAYDQTTQTATTDAHVKLVGDGLLLEGVGLVFHVAEHHLRLQAAVKGILDPARLK